MKNKEIWKNIKNYEGLYQVSNLGRVRSVERVVKFRQSSKIVTRIIPERILKACLNTNGYLIVNLYKEGIKKCLTLHRIVAKAFLNKPLDWQHVEKYQHHGYTINHIDGIKTNNHIDNLEWATQSENIQHAIDTGLSPNVDKKIKVLLIELNLEFESLNEAARWVRDNTDNPKANCGLISNVINGKRKTAYKYNWKAI